VTGLDWIGLGLRLLDFIEFWGFGDGIRTGDGFFPDRFEIKAAVVALGVTVGAAEGLPASAPKTCQTDLLSARFATAGLLLLRWSYRGW